MEFIDVVNKRKTSRVFLDKDVDFDLIKEIALIWKMGDFFYLLCFPCRMV